MRSFTTFLLWQQAHRNHTYVQIRDNLGVLVWYLCSRYAGRSADAVCPLGNHHTILLGVLVGKVGEENAADAFIC